jgi:hypothetical protein
VWVCVKDRVHGSSTVWVVATGRTIRECRQSAVTWFVETGCEGVSLCSGVTARELVGRSSGTGCAQGGLCLRQRCQGASRSRNHVLALVLLQVIEDVDKDRRYAIDAAIVRTMKSRKVGPGLSFCVSVSWPVSACPCVLFAGHATLASPAACLWTKPQASSTSSCCCLLAWFAPPDPSVPVCPILAANPPALRVLHCPSSAITPEGTSSWWYSGILYVPLAHLHHCC